MPWFYYGRKAILVRQIDSVISICSNVSASIGAVRRVNAIIQPYFDYCSPLWDNCRIGLKDRLQKYQKSGCESNHWINLRYLIV